jgi:CubicO group peptidase (beta-lactamase class C family)
LVGCAHAPERTGPIGQGDYRYLSEYLDWMIATEMRRAKVPGVSIAVVDDRRIVWSKGFGWADAANAVPATPDTRYRVGSISKLITATEIVRRVDRGALDLDSPVASVLPEFSVRNRFAEARPVTVRSLLAHHSGLPSGYLKGMWDTDPESLAELVVRLRDTSLASPPQTQFRYSNAGYSMLGRLIEQQAGQPFADALQRDLLDPLGMNRSAFAHGPQPPAPYAKAYRKGEELSPIGLRDAPAGALLSSVTDMAQFIRFVLADGRVGDERLIRAQTLRTMFESQFAGLPLDFGHAVGLGWMLNGVSVPGAGPLSWHNGQWPGYYGCLLVAREQKLGVIVLANGEEASRFALPVATKALELALEAKRGVAVAAPPVPTNREPVALAPERLDEYAGNYVIFATLSRISRKGDRLAGDFAGNGIDLIPVGDEVFVPKKSVLGLFDITLPNLSLRFTAVQDRRFAVLDGLPVPFAFERLREKPIPAAWRSRVGSYRCDNGDASLDFKSMELAIDEGLLVAKVAGFASRLWGYEGADGRVALEAISDDEAIVTGVGNDEGGVLRVVRGEGRERIVYSGYVLTTVGGGAHDH